MLRLKACATWKEFYYFLNIYLFIIYLSPPPTGEEALLGEKGEREKDEGGGRRGRGRRGRRKELFIYF
jgi:hypothetical protein